MEKNNDYANLAYVKSEELEELVSRHENRITHLEILYGSIPAPEDPDDIEDTTYEPPPPGTIINQGIKNSVPYYIQSKVTAITQKYHFTAEAHTATIVKAELVFEVIQNNEVSYDIELLINGEIAYSHPIHVPLLGTYHIPIATFFNPTRRGNFLQIRVVPSRNNYSEYRLIESHYEILGSNVDLLTPHYNYSVHYHDDTYYICKTQQNYSNYLIQNTGGVNLNAEYTPHFHGVTWQKFLHNYRYVDGKFVRDAVACAVRNTIGHIQVINFEDTTRKLNAGNAYNIAVVFFGSQIYWGHIVLANQDGVLLQKEMAPNFSSSSERIVYRQPEDYHVSVTEVQHMKEGYYHYPKNMPFIATTLDGENEFFSSIGHRVQDFYKVQLGYGATPTACFRNLEQTIIDVYMRVYDKIVHKVLEVNPDTERFELSEQQTVIGTWQYYIPGFPPAYFTIASDQLKYTKPTP